MSRIPPRRTYDGSDIEILPIEHLCHAKNCNVPVAPKFLMCPRHWYMVPRLLRLEVWRLYRPGQEVDKRPTREYLDVMKRAIDAVAEQEEKRVE